MKRKLFGALVLLVAVSVGMPSFCFAGEIVLMFPAPKLKEQTATGEAYEMPWMSRKEVQEYSPIKLSEFVKELEKHEYKVDQIELWIEAKVESGNISKLFISIGGSGGCRVILKPRSK